MNRPSMEEEQAERRYALLSLAQSVDELLSRGKVCEAYITMVEGNPGINHSTALSLIGLSINSCAGS